MAVVADSHRSFLTPEQRRPQSQMTLRGMPDNEFSIRWAVLFFCTSIIAPKKQKSIEKRLQKQPFFFYFSRE